MSLNLGHIPFPAGHTSYTPPEHRLRKGHRQNAPAGGIESAAGARRSSPIEPRPRGSLPAQIQREPMSRLAELSIRPDTFGPMDERFLLGAAEERMGGSVVASLVSHAVGIGVLMLLINLMPERVYDMVQQNRENYGIIWLPEDGPGGGGGGGGNESLQLPQEVEVEGLDEAELSLPVAEPEPVEVDLKPDPEPIQTQEFRMPAVSMASAPETRAGVLEGLMAATSLSRGSGRGGGAGSGEGTGSGPGEGSGVGPGIGGGAGGGLYRPGSGIENPQLVREVKPRYTAEAMRAKVQGIVWLEVVVRSDGSVGDVTVTKSLDTVFGLDEEAIRAARQWRFLPGTRFGTPVAVLVGIELSFTLR